MIGYVEELNHEPKCHINQPHIITGDAPYLQVFTAGSDRTRDYSDVLRRWPKHTTDEDILLFSDSVLTICEPKNDVRLVYLEKTIPVDIKERANEPVLLMEEPELPDDEDDTFYVETGIDGML